MKYLETQIQSVMMLLNNMDVKGLDNAKRVCAIAQILQNPIKEENDGKRSKEE